MSDQVIAIRTTCRSCLEPRKLDGDGLCERCGELNESLDGALLALVTPEDEKRDE